MTEAEFYVLLQRYLDGRCTPAEQARVAQWYDQLQDQAAGAHPLPSPPPQVVEAAIWQRLRLDPALPKPAPRVRRLPARLWHTPQVRWAASIGLLLLGLGGLLPAVQHWQAAQAPTAATSARGWTRHHNTTTQAQVVELPDASRVTLQPGSTLRYATALAGARREVYLEGEAFFSGAQEPGAAFPGVYQPGSDYGTRYELRRESLPR